MAIDATFQFDMSSAPTEAEKAIAALGRVETEAAKTTAAVGGIGGAAPAIARIPPPANLTQAALRGLGQSLSQVDSTLGAFGVRVGPVERAVNELAGVAGKTATELGAVATAGAVAGSALAGWQLGRFIAELTGADQKVQELATHMFGLGDATAEGAAAKLNTLTLASQHAGKQITDYTDAIKINEDWTRRSIAVNKDYADMLARMTGPEKLIREMVDWREEIDKVAGQGRLPLLNQLIKEGIIPLGELATAYGVSEAALRHYADQVRDLAALQKKASDDLAALDQLFLERGPILRAELDALGKKRHEESIKEIDDLYAVSEAQKKARDTEDDLRRAEEKSLEVEKQRAAAAAEAAHRANLALGSSVDYSRLPGANLLGGKTVEDFLHELQQQYRGTPLAPGENLPTMAVEAFKAAAASALAQATRAAAPPPWATQGGFVSNVTVNVSGVIGDLTPASQQKLADVVGGELMKRLRPTRQLPTV